MKPKGKAWVHRRRWADLGAASFALCKAANEAGLSPYVTKVGTISCEVTIGGRVITVFPSGMYADGCLHFLNAAEVVESVRRASLPGKFRRLAYDVDAIQFTGTNGADVVAFMGSHVTDAGDNFGDRLVVETLEGALAVEPGSWVVRGVAGEYHPVRDDIFQATYEPKS